MAPGTRKKFVPPPRVRNWGLAEANLLHWRKYLWHFWYFPAAHAVIRRPGNCAPLSPLVTPLGWRPFLSALWEELLPPVCNDTPWVIDSTIKCPTSRRLRFRAATFQQYFPLARALSYHSYDLLPPRLCVVCCSAMLPVPLRIIIMPQRCRSLLP